MTFLEICKRLRQEASVIGEGPASTSSQTGEMQRLINWVNTAYEEIQNMRPDWRFMTKDFSFNTVAGANNYTVIGIGLADFANWNINSLRIYQTDIGAVNEQWFYPLDYENEFRDTRGFSSTQLVQGRPYEFAVKPDNSLITYPIPDATGYTIRGQYYRTAHIMVNDIDTPIFPNRFHMAIVWKALMYYGMYESAQEAISQGERNFNNVYSKLSFDQSFKMHPSKPFC